MIIKQEVQKFLNQFHEKMKVFGIIYRDDRGKNQKALEILEIVPSYRKVIIENLKVENYVQGPVIDELNKTRRNVGLWKGCKRTGSLY